MTVDSTIQLLRTSSLPRLRANIEKIYSEDHVFYEKLVNLLSFSQPVGCDHEFEDVGVNRRCLRCGHHVPRSSLSVSSSPADNTSASL